MHNQHQFRTPPAGAAPFAKSNIRAVACGFLAACALIASVLLQLMDTGRWVFAMVLAAVILVDAALWFGYVAGKHESFALKAGFVALILHAFMPLFMCLALPLDADYIFPWGDYIFKSPFQAAFAFLAGPVAICLVLLTFSLIPSRQPGLPVRRMIDDSGARFEWFLIFAAFLKLSIWFTVLLPGNPIFYLLRVLTYALTVVPFFAGYCALKYKKATLAWVVTIGLSLLASAYTGARGAAFYPAIYFLIGFFLGLRTHRERFSWGLIIGVPSVVMLGLLGVYIGLARDVVGRTDLRGAATGNRSVYDAALDSSVQREMLTKLQEGVAFKVFQRLALWPIPVIPAMTPDPIAYRGFSDITDELKAATQLGMISGQLNSGGIYFSNLYLKPYGFAVHASRYGQVSNVEMPVFTDAFTRGGWIAGIIFLYLAYSVVYVAEQLLKRYLIVRYQCVFLILLSVLGTISAVRINMEPLIDVVRATILYGGFSLVTFYCFDRALSYIGVKR